MTQLEQAARQALEALNRSDYLGWQVNIPIIKALRAALEQPAQDEPVAWMHPDGRIWTFGRGFDKATFTVPLYTRPQAHEPLTDAKVEYLTTALKDLLEMPEYDGTQATAQVRLRAKNQAKRALKAVQHEESSSLPG